MRAHKNWNVSETLEGERAEDNQSNSGSKEGDQGKAPRRGEEVDEAQAATSPRGHAPTEAELETALLSQCDGTARIAQVYRYLHSGVVTKPLAYNRVRGLAEAASKYEIRDGKMFTKEPTPRRVCVTDSEREHAL